MDLELNGKVVLVTGAGAGMGQKIALRFAREGAQLILNDLKEDYCRETASLAAEVGAKVTAVAADVSSGAAVGEMFGRIDREIGRLDVLVNNAGLLRPKNIVDLPEDEWDKLIGVNLKSVFLCSKAAIPLMRRAGSGVIANASSFTAVIPSAGLSAYSAAKAAVANLTRTMAGELAPYGIRVVGYIPGVIETNLTLAMRQSNLQGLVDPIALRRCGKPEEVADVVVFLCSGPARYMSGALVEISGGKFCVQNASAAWAAVAG